MMLQRMKSMQDYAIQATDGIIGRVKDSLFDDAAWVVRYFIVQTDRWLARRLVLISAASISRPDHADKSLSALISKEQVRLSPRFDLRQPLSRADEESHLQHYGHPHYWTQGDSLWSGGVSVGGTPSPDEKLLRTHLHSCNTVTGYQVHATDGAIGRIDGLLVEDKTWAIRYLVVNPERGLKSHGVLIAPEWIDDIEWAESTVVLDVSQEAVSAAPSYDPTRDLNRDVESQTYAHYGKDHYWRAPPQPESDVEQP